MNARKSRDRRKEELKSLKLHNSLTASRNHKWTQQMDCVVEFKIIRYSKQDVIVTTSGEKKKILEPVPVFSFCSVPKWAGQSVGCYWGIKINFARSLNMQPFRMRY
jgi:hypothetical protein